MGQFSIDSFKSAAVLILVLVFLVSGCGVDNAISEPEAPNEEQPVASEEETAETPSDQHDTDTPALEDDETTSSIKLVPANDKAASTEAYYIRNLENYLLEKCYWYGDNDVLLAFDAMGESEGAKFYYFNTDSLELKHLYDSGDIYIDHSDKFLANDDYIVFEHGSGTIFFDKKILEVLDQPPFVPEVHSLWKRFSNDLKYMAYAKDNGLHLVNLATGEDALIYTPPPDGKGEQIDFSAYVYLIWSPSSQYLGFLDYHSHVFTLIDVDNKTSQTYTVGQEIPKPDQILELTQSYPLNNGGVFFHTLLENGSAYMHLDNNNAQEPDWTFWGENVTVFEIQQDRVLHSVNKRTLSQYNWTTTENVNLYSSDHPVITSTYSPGGSRIIFHTYEFDTKESILHIIDGFNQDKSPLNESSQDQPIASVEQKVIGIIESEGITSGGIYPSSNQQSSYSNTILHVLDGEYAIVRYTEEYGVPPSFPRVVDWFLVNLEDRSLVEIRADCSTIVGYNDDIVSIFDNGIDYEVGTLGFPKIVKYNVKTQEMKSEPYYVSLSDPRRFTLGHVSIPDLDIDQIEVREEAFTISFTTTEDTELVGGGPITRIEFSNAMPNKLTVDIYAASDQKVMSSLTEQFTGHSLVDNVAVESFTDINGYNHTVISMSFLSERIYYTAGFSDMQGSFLEVEVALRQQPNQ